MENESKKIKTFNLINDIDLKYFIAGVGVLAAIGGLYFAYRQDKRALQQQDEKAKQQREPTAENNKNECHVKNLDNFD